MYPRITTVLGEECVYMCVCVGPSLKRITLSSPQLFHGSHGHVFVFMWVCNELIKFSLRQLFYAYNGHM
jgi:hypothetical protein